MDRREAIKTMGLAIAAVAMASVAPNTYAAILKDRAKDKKRLMVEATKHDSECANTQERFMLRFSSLPLTNE